MKIEVKNLEPNPYRNIKKYPFDKEKLKALKTSITETSFWDNILARPSGKGRPRNNHWLDCVAGCCAGAEILGFRLMQTGQAVKVGKKVRLSEVQAERRNR